MRQQGSRHAPREWYFSFCVGVSHDLIYLQKKEGCSSVTCFHQINETPLNEVLGNLFKGVVEVVI